MTTKGVWGLQDVRDKLLAGDNWENTQSLYLWGDNGYGALGLNQSGSPQRYSSPVQLPGTWATDRETIVARQGYGAWAMQE